MGNYVSNEQYENGESLSAESAATKSADELEKESENVVSFSRKEKKRECFAIWSVGDDNYRLKLTPTETMELEKVYKCNLMNIMGDADNIPSLTTMLQITHAAMKKWHHGIKLKDVENLYCKYVEAGGSMLQFYIDVFMKIYAVSGFFSQSMEEDMTDAMEKMSENI